MPSKILFIDDEPQLERLVRQRLRKRIRSKDYILLFAENGKIALEVLSKEEGIALVLSDINMPIMDGLTFLDEVKTIKPAIKTIMVSAYGNMDNIRKAMNNGAFDFVVKPIDFTDLEATIDKGLKEISQIKLAEQTKEKLVKTENQLHFSELEKKRLGELDEMKSRFITNISHEFRTPLTVILGMASQVKEEPEKWLNRGTNLIQRNGSNLLNLVNQLLDLRKLEAGKLSINYIKGDVIAYLKYIGESFQSLAESQDIQFHFSSNEGEWIMPFDQEKILRIVSNLLSNAIKFTSEGGQVFFRIEKLKEATSNYLKISVKDTGKGISNTQLVQIFDRFYQADENHNHHKGEGTGIGLSLTKELVQLLNGKIEVQSKENQGSHFQIILPAPNINLEKLSDTKVLTLPETLEILIDDSKSVNLDIPDANIPLPTLLIVEDSPDIVHYLTSLLEGQYQLFFAEDGEIGIKKALEEIPDIIITDLMMPNKNGYELCEALKSDTRTSHIPIVMLTAKADQDAKIEGLKKGADVYLAKPFNKRELFIRLEKLLEMRRQLQIRFSGSEKIIIDQTEFFQQEDRFMDKFKNLLISRMDDEEFGINEICQEIGLSRSHLHKKIKALTNRSTSHFIRLLRLKKAHELLQTSDLNITEIAYEVGFKDPKYFTRTYKQEFGESPKQVRK